METIELRISGIVQGVFFRASAKEIADQLGITGWVRNTEEGEVWIRATGNREALEQFREWCRKGPSRASVEKIDETQMDTEAFAQFRILR